MRSCIKPYINGLDHFAGCHRQLWKVAMSKGRAFRFCAKTLYQIGFGFTEHAHTRDALNRHRVG